MGTVEKIHRMSPSIEYEDATVIARLKRDVRLNALQWHQAFAASHIHLPGDLPPSVEIEDHWSHVKMPGFGSRLVCVRHLPFEAQATTRKMWAALTAFGSSTGPGPVSIVDRSPDECTLKFHAQIQLDESDALTALEYHALTQQEAGVQADGKSLFVWQSVWTDAQGSGTAASRGLQSLVVRRVSDQLSRLSRIRN